jgi:DNA-binding beta-propeller fold protein YncE
MMKKHGHTSRALRLLVICLSFVLSGAAVAWAAGFYPVGSWAPVKTLAEPTDVAVAMDGEVFIADSSGRRIVVADAEGNFLREFDGTAGVGVELQRPTALALGPDGRLYVADRAADRILVFERDGRLVTWWGSRGTGAGQFMAASDVTFDAAGLLYVADTFNDRIQVFDTAGVFQRVIGVGSLSTPSGVVVRGTGTAAELFVAETNTLRVSVYALTGGAPKREWGWTTSGSGATSVTTSRYLRPAGVELLPSGNILVIDAGRHLIENCNPTTGNVATSYGGSGKLAQPEGLFAGPGTTLYIADTLNNRVARLDTASPATITLFVPDPSDVPVPSSPKGVASYPGVAGYYTESGTGLVKRTNASGAYTHTFSSTPVLSSPSGLMVTRDGNEVYVCDTGNNRIVVYSSFGAHLRTFGSMGSGAGQFKSPSGITQLPGGDIAVADTGNNRIQVVSSTGSYVREFGAARLRSPMDVASLSNGRIIVADTANHRLALFEGDGTWVQGVGGFGTAPGQFNSPSSVTVGSVDDLIVADRGNSRIQILAVDGSPLSSFGTRGSGPGELDEPYGAAPLSAERMMIADTMNHRVGVLGYDAVPPVTQASGAISGWTNSKPATVTLSASDVGAGVEATYYRLGTGPITLYSGPVGITAEGQTQVTYWSVDRMGNDEAPKAVTVRLDTIPPSGSATFGSMTQYVKPGTLTVFSAVSGATEMRVGRTGAMGPWVPYATTATINLTIEGTTTLVAEYRDLAGNVLVQTHECVVDGTGPVTSIQRTPSSAVSTGAVVIDLSAIDALAQVDRIIYKLDGRAEQQYSGPVTVSTDGPHSFEAWDIDTVGNTGSKVTVSFGISRLMMGGQLTIAGGQPYVRFRTVEASTTVQSAVRMRWDTGGGYTAWLPFVPQFSPTFPIDGQQTLRVQFEDAIGQQLTLTASTWIDTVPPVTTINGVPPTGISGGPVMLEFTAQDATPYTTRYSIDGGPTRLYELPFTVTGDGLRVISFFSTDAAGNEEVAKTASFLIAATPPAGTMRVVQGTPVARVDLDLAISLPGATRMRFDTGSGPGAWMPYATSAAVRMPGEGVHWIVGTFANIADVQSQVATQVLVDLSPPRIAVQGLPDGGVSAAPVTFSASAVDSYTPVASLTYSVDGAAARSYRSPVTVSGDGQHTIELTARDSVGNVAPVQRHTFVISSLAKGGTLAIAGGAPRVGTRTVDVTTDVTGATLMRWDAGEGFGAWIPFAASWQVTFPREGTGVVTAQFRNQFGVEVELAASTYVDLTPPITRVAGIPPGGIGTGPVLIVLTADDVSPIAGIEYSLDGGSVRPYTVPVVVAGDGLRTLRVRARDAVGNVESFRTHTFIIDSTRGGSVGVAGGGSFVNTLTVGLASTVPSATQMRFDVGDGFSPWTAYAPSATVRVSNEGLNWIVASFRDAVGVETTFGVPVFVDLVAPRVTYLTSSVPRFTVSSKGVVRYVVTLTAKGSDEGTSASGPASWRWRLGTKTSTTKTGTQRTFTSMTAGRHRSSAALVDRAANAGQRTGLVRLGASRGPVVPKTAAPGRAFAIKGTVPVAGSGSAYRVLGYRRAANGTWVLAKTYTATPRISGSTATVARRIALTRGTWRIVLLSQKGSARVLSAPSAAISVK